MKFFDYLMTMSLALGVLIISSISVILIIAKHISCENSTRWILLLVIIVITILNLWLIIYDFLNYVKRKSKNKQIIIEI